MKYVRNIDDLKRYTFEFFDSFLPQNMSDKMVNYFLLDTGFTMELQEGVLNEIKKNPLNENVVVEYGEVILQLRDYRDLLKRFVELLLKSKSFEQLSSFLNRIFLQQIGPAKYHSSQKDYTIRQRYFDRFIEIVDYCNIPKDLYTPFFVAIYNSDPMSNLFYYKEPLNEYLDIFLKNGNQDFVSKLVGEKQESAPSFSAKPTQKETIHGVRSMVEEYVNGAQGSTQLIKSTIERNKMLFLGIVEEYLACEDEKLMRVCELLSYIEDRHAKDDLKRIYMSTHDAKIKSYLEKTCGFTPVMKFDSEQDFLSYVDSAVTKIQDRLYGIRLTRYYKAYELDNTGINGKVMTFVLDTFRAKDSDAQIAELKEYFKFVDVNVLQSLCDIVFEIAVNRNRLLSSRWAIRFISCFGSPSLIEKVFENMSQWYTLKDLQKPCEYFLDIMSLCARKEMIAGIRKLLNNDLSSHQRKFLQNRLATFSESNKEDLEQVKDKLVDDLGFDTSGKRVMQLNRREVVAQINLDCSITLFNAKTGKPARINDRDSYNWQNVHEYIKSCVSKIKAQKKRLYSAFLEFRNYTYESFKECILDNNLLNFLSQHIYWGRYKNDHLVEVCVVKDSKLTHLVGNMLAQESDYSIAMLQPIDAVELKDKIAGETTLLFDQLDFPYFTYSDFNPNANYIDKLAGTFCNAQLFITRLQKIKYKIADLDMKGTFGMLVKKNENLNLITSVEFDRVPLRNYNCPTTLSKIRFYDLNRQNKNVKTATLDKANALMLTNINPHVLSNEIALVLNACKN